MDVTGIFRKKDDAYGVVLFLTILFMMFIAFNSADIYAANNKLIIDPESISVDNDKEGNVLAEYGFAVFTEESMLDMHSIKSRKEKERKQMVSGLFESKWKGSTNYDKEVKEVIKSAALFEKVNTGVEMTGDTGINPREMQKWRRRILVILLMCIMSEVAVRWNRKRYENNHNVRTR